MKNVFGKFLIGVLIFLSCSAGLFSSGGYNADYAVEASSSAQRVYLGGMPVGITLSAEGVVVVGKAPVVTAEGLKSPSEKTDINNGDIIIKINGIKVQSIADVHSAVNGGETELTIKRGGQVIIRSLTTATDVLSGEARLGLTIKEEVGGVGTVTYFTKDGRFGALGHHVTDFETGLSSELNRGNIYKCSVVGVVKGKRGAAGELKGIFSKFSDSLGVIDKNNTFGIYGNAAGGYENLKLTEVAQKGEVRPGKAYLYTTIGDSADFYEIQIIKASTQDAPKEKGMVISVTDKRLLEATGGIVQGMSGSPIVQNGKLAGAVTHVFVNDPTKGYGLFIGCMLEN